MIKFFWSFLLFLILLTGWLDALDIKPDQTADQSVTQVGASNSLSNTINPIKGWEYFPFGVNYSITIDILSNEYPQLQRISPPFPDFDETTDYHYFATYEDIYVKKAEFQFNKDRALYLTRLVMNPKYFSFLKLYEILSNKYGVPQVRTFNKLTWIDNDKTLNLTRDNVITYFSDEYLQPTVQSNFKPTEPSQIQREQPREIQELVNSL